MNKKSLIIYSLFMITISSIVSVIMVSAMNSSEIEYCRDNNNNPVTVAQAIDTLYDSVEVTTITPIGSILPYMGTTAPTNYLICDGTVYNIADYKKLADHIKDNFGSYDFFGGNGETTFAVPDLRGEFLRGAGNNSHTDQGNGANVGVHQDATVHLGTTLAYGHWLMFTSDGNGVDEEPSNVDSNIGETNYSTWANKGSQGSNLSYQGKYTSRPTNTSVNYIIKVK